jgi:DNA-binding transcriptional regulator YdaS (Cro superfamily)
MASHKEALQRAIKLAGTQADLAKAMTAIGRETTQQAVSWWLANTAPPPDACEAIEQVTGVQCEELNDKFHFIRVDGKFYTRERKEAA